MEAHTLSYASFIVKSLVQYLCRFNARNKSWQRLITALCLFALVQINFTQREGRDAIQKTMAVAALCLPDNTWLLTVGHVTRSRRRDRQ